MSMLIEPTYWSHANFYVNKKVLCSKVLRSIAIEQRHPILIKIYFFGKEDILFFLQTYN
jgi:hypothetical protein